MMMGMTSLYLQKLQMKPRIDFLGFFLFCKFSYSRHFICMMLDDTRCGLDVQSLHRTTSMVNYISKKFRLLSCHLDTLSIAKYKTKEKLRSYLPSFLFRQSLTIHLQNFSQLVFVVLLLQYFQSIYMSCICQIFL